MSKKIKKDLDKNLNIELKTHITTLNIHKGYIYCLTLLNDKRLVSGSDDNNIIIYHKETYEPDIIIKEHTNTINCLTQLKNGYLASGSWDSTIKLFSIKETNYEIIQTLNFHLNYVNKILELSNNYLVSCSNDSTIIFYIKKDLIYTKDYSISTSNIIWNIIETKENNEIAYSTNSFNNGEINFFDLNKRKNKLIIPNIYSSFNSFYMISKDLLLIGGNNIINIINVKEYIKIKEINFTDAGMINGVCMLNSNIIITGDEHGILRIWKLEKDNIILIYKKVKAHNNFINSILNLGNNHIITGSIDKTIKIW